ARRYVESFERARSEHASRARQPVALRTFDSKEYQLPALKLDHLLALTDSTGLFQHAVYTVPNWNEGYCTDDNARGYILTTLLEQDQLLDAALSAEVQRLTRTFFAFLWHSYNPATGRFRNFMGYDRHWLEDSGSEDSHGRALWAIGTALGRSTNHGHQQLAGRLFEQALPAVHEFTSPRAWAFTILAVHEYLRRYAGDREANGVRESLTQKLLDLYEDNAQSPDWPWFENSLTYDNARLSHALILTGHWTAQHDVFEIGLKTLLWLVEIQTAPSGCFSPVGSNGFYRRGGVRARFDQQPIEASAMVSACLEAHRLTGEAAWLQRAQRIFEWFLGRNDLSQPLYDATTGGCHDGLHPDRVNSNEGAESTLAFHLALAELRLANEAASPEAVATEMKSPADQAA
ncbi:MAG: glycosyl transferase family 1, partial [Verrucomicrobia bacterium]|nr:glycosyl transferase family 1 [Verrucomicrobiota bacterium]